MNLLEFTGTLADVPKVCHSLICAAHLKALVSDLTLIIRVFSSFLNHRTLAINFSWENISHLPVYAAQTWKSSLSIQCSKVISANCEFRLQWRPFSLSVSTLWKVLSDWVSCSPGTLFNTLWTMWNCLNTNTHTVCKANLQLSQDIDLHPQVQYTVIAFTDVFCSNKTYKESSSNSLPFSLSLIVTSSHPIIYIKLSITSPAMHEIKL